MEITDSVGYKRLLSSVERDEKESPNFHNYREKLDWVISRAKYYSEKTGIDASDILCQWENERSYWYMNYYQESNQPKIEGDKVRIFDTIDDFLKSIGKKEFRCPLCGGISKNPYLCDSGLVVKNIKDGRDGQCNWKVYGLLGDLGKGVYIFIKSKLSGEKIFMPVSWESKTDDSGKNK